MASQRDIRRRIGAVRNIRQITRAMQFVAASKLKRAQDATLAARPYSEKLDEVLADVAAVLSGDEHPLLATADPAGKRLIVLITTDRPLAGPLTSNAVRFTLREVVDQGAGGVTMVTVGRKGRDAIRRAGIPIEAHFAGFGDRPTFADVTIPAVSSTPRCCTMLGSAMSNGRASSLTEAGPRESRSTIARRLPSPSAWNMRSRET